MNFIWIGSLPSDAVIDAVPVIDIFSSSAMGP